MEQLKDLIIKKDFKNIRKVRQENNNNIVYENLKNNQLEELNKNINIKEYERVLKDLNISEKDLINKCRDDNLFCKLVSRSISKLSSRQGCKDESEQLKICNTIAKEVGILIKNLSPTEFRPTNFGEILSGKEIKQKEITLDNCLKSFDAKILGKMKGYITAKVSFGNGGHQDNVFDEIDTISMWWLEHKSNSDEVLVVLVDTNLIKEFNILKKKYEKVNNIMWFNHIEFQEYIIDKYYNVDSI